HASLSGWWRLEARLPRGAPFPHGPGGRDTSSGAARDLAGDPRAAGRASATGAVRVSGVDVRVRDRRAGLRAPVSPSRLMELRGCAWLLVLSCVARAQGGEPHTGVAMTQDRSESPMVLGGDGWRFTLYLRTDGGLGIAGRAALRAAMAAL